MIHEFQHYKALRCEEAWQTAFTDVLSDKKWVKFLFIRILIIQKKMQVCKGKRELGMQYS